MEKTDWEHGMEILAAALDDDHPFGSAKVKLGEHELEVMVADTAETRARGMSGRGWGASAGMLFVHDRQITADFHMRDVGVHIALLCFDADGLLVAWRSMLAGDETRRYPISEPFTYALEVPLEWAVENKIWESADFLVVAQVAPADQRSKSEANYRPSEDETTSCAGCVNFMPPMSCAKVVGSIEHSATCDHNEPRPVTLD